MIQCCLFLRSMRTTTTTTTLMMKSGKLFTGKVTSSPFHRQHLRRHGMTNMMFVSQRNKNFFSSSSSSSSPMEEKINACENGKQVSEIIRFNPLAFTTSATGKESKSNNNKNLLLLSNKIHSLISRNKIINDGREVAGLLNAISKIQVREGGSDGKVLQQRLMSDLCKAVVERKSKKSNFTTKSPSKSSSSSSSSMILLKRPKEIGIVFNALARTNTRDESFLRQLVQAALPRIHQFNAIDLCHTANACAKLKYKNRNSRRLFDKIAISAIIKMNGTRNNNNNNNKRMDDFSSQGLSNLVNAYAKMNHPHPKLFNEVAKTALPILPTFSSQGLANTVHAFAKMNQRNTKLFDKIGKVSIPKLGTYNSQNLSNTVNAFAKMNHKYPELFHEVAKVSIPLLDTFTSQELAITVNAFAKMNHVSPELFNEVARVSITKINSFTCQELAITVNAFARMDHKCSRLFDEVAKVAVPTIHDHQQCNNNNNSQELAITVNAFAKMGHKCPKLFDVVANASLRIIDTFTCQELAITVNAFAKMDHKHPIELFENVARVALPLLVSSSSSSSSSFAPNEVSNLISGFARVGANGKWVNSFFTNTAAILKNDNDVLSSYDERNLVEILYGFLKARRTDLDLLNRIGIEISNNNNPSRLDALGLGNLASAFSREKVESSKAVLSLIFHRFQNEIPRDGIELQNVADICKAIWIGQALDVIPPKFLSLLVEYVTEMADQSRPADVRDILLNLGSSKTNLDYPLRLKLLLTYEPYFQKHSKFIAQVHCEKIQKIYSEFVK